MRLLPVAEADAVVREHVETTHFIDATGQLYEPTEPPYVSESPDWDPEPPTGR